MALRDNLQGIVQLADQKSARHRDLIGRITELASTIAPDPVESLPGMPSDGPPAAAVGRAVGGGGDAGGFDPDFQRRLNQMIKESGGRISVKSGYRSPKRQGELWAQALKKYGSEAAARKWVAPPGKSNHGRGLAADLGYSGKDAISWAHQNAGKYGLNFPLANENWHIEPVTARKRAKHAGHKH